MRSTRKPPRRVLRRPAATIDQAVALATEGRATAGSSAMFLVTRVGCAEFVPPRYRVGQCSECEAPVWIGGDLVDATERRGMTVIALCFQCAAGGEPS